MKNTIFEMLEDLGNDVIYFDLTDTVDHYISIDFNDFDGFDDDWGEVDRDYDNPEKVDGMLEFLEKHCSSKEDGYYTIYHFDGFDVQVGYTSYDI